MSIYVTTLTLSGFITGFVGDLALQYITIDDRHGLKSYFEQHGGPESALLGSMLTGSWTFVFDLLNLPQRFLPVYALLLDEIYRQYYKVLYPSLETYYKKNTRTETLIYNATVGALILLTDKFINY